MKKIDFSKMDVQNSIGNKTGISGSEKISGDCYTCDSSDGDNGGMCDCDDGGSDEK